MSDNRNPVLDNFTGITAAIGGYNSWSPYGGSRLILTKGDNYKLFDLTNGPIELKYTLNVSQLQCGINNAVYMVPMIDADPDNFNLNNLAGTLYNDAQNIGFVQKDSPNSNNSNNMNSRLGRTEIDITECSPRGIQTTLHGYGKNSQNSQKPDRWQNDLDMSGIWRNANVDEKGIFLGDGNLVYGNSKQKDTLPSDAIDTVNPIDVYCKITSTIVPNSKQTYQDGKVTGPFYTLKMETVISQKGKNDIYMMVDSANPKGEHDITTYFPASELQNMVLLWSLWADTKEHDYLNWLDGTVDGASFGKHRGNCTENEYEPIGLFQEAVNFFSKPTTQSCDDTNKCGSHETKGSNGQLSNFQTVIKNNGASLNTFITNLYDLSIKGESDLTSYGWVMDYGYRGINEHQFKQEEGGDCGAGKQCTYFKPDSSQEENWKGRYNFSYLNCNITPDYNIPTPNTEISNNALNLTDWSNACTILINDGNNIMNQRNEDLGKSCNWDSQDASCQKIDMPLVDFGSSPSPPNPCPNPPCPPGPPGPPGTHSSSLSIVGIISLSLSALIIIIILLMIFHVKFTF